MALHLNKFKEKSQRDEIVAIANLLYPKYVCASLSILRLWEWKNQTAQVTYENLVNIVFQVEQFSKLKCCFLASMIM